MACSNPSAEDATSTVLRVEDGLRLMRSTTRRDRNAVSATNAPSTTALSRARRAAGGLTVGRRTGGRARRIKGRGRRADMLMPIKDFKPIPMIRFCDMLRLRLKRCFR